VSNELNTHHILPTSRGGDEGQDNLMKLDRDFHDYWHRVTQNLTVKEAHIFFDILFEGGTYYDSKRIHELREHLKKTEIAYFNLDYELEER